MRGANILGLAVAGSSGAPPTPAAGGSALSESLRDVVVAGDVPAHLADGAPASQRYRRFARSIAASDFGAIVLAIVLARFVHVGTHSSGPRFPQLLILGPLVTVGVFAVFGLYATSRLSPAEEFRRIIEALSVAALIKLFTDLFLTEGPRSFDVLSRGWLVVAWALAVALTLTGRGVWHKYMGRLRASGRLQYRTLILGANAEAASIAHTLSTPALGYGVVGMIRTSNAPVVFDGVPLLGDLEELAALIDEHGVECLFVASTAVDPQIMKRVAKHIRHTSVELRVSANIQQMLASRLTIQPVGDLLALSLRPVRLTGAQAAVKRSFDIVVGTVASLLVLPFGAAIALAIKVTSRGPVFYRQERVGQNGEPFRMFKFRTMVRNADALLPQLLERNEFRGGVLFKLRDDPRVTRVGRFLRRWSLDELPQLLNVLVGHMSLVGPRPALASEVATYEEWHRDRLEVRPGITGLWQVGGRSELSFDDYVRLDLFYIENWSVMYDLFILAKTIPAVLLRKGAF
jgi:exopolysaccharide biosynthesis polyprenyl glycosylphosphotransferase